MALIDISIDGRPAALLLQAIFHTLGYDPASHKLVTDARARRDAARIDAQGKVELEKFERRLRSDFGSPSDWHNVESTISGAIPHLNADARADQIEPDKLRFLLEKIKVVSQDEMQALWARILAGEANRPGAFSKRAIEFVSVMDRYDADSFTKLCSFCLGSRQETVVTTYQAENIYLQNGVTREIVSHLASIGLLGRAGILGFGVKGAAGKQFIFEYFGTKYAFIAGSDLRYGDFELTKVAKELAPISGAKPIPEFPQYMVSKWSGKADD